MAVWRCLWSAGSAGSECLSRDPSELWLKPAAKSIHGPGPGWPNGWCRKSESRAKKERCELSALLCRRAKRWRSGREREAPNLGFPAISRLPTIAPSWATLGQRGQQIGLRGDQCAPLLPLLPLCCPRSVWYVAGQNRRFSGLFALLLPLLPLLPSFWA